MTKKISTFVFLGLILTVIVWMLDKNSVATLDWRNYQTTLSVPGLSKGLHNVTWRYREQKSEPVPGSS